MKVWFPRSGNILNGTQRQTWAAAGAQLQRLFWASTGTKDPDTPDALYIEVLAAPDTINSMPEKTLLAFAEHGQLHSALPADGGDAEAILAEFAHAGDDYGTLAAQLQRECAAVPLEDAHILWQR